MELNNKILSDITVFSKYAKHIPALERRETWKEIIDRYVSMMIEKYPSLEEQIKSNSQLILDKKILPSMRSLQFAGPAIESNESRIYNCAFFPVDHHRAFSEAMFLLLGGTGVGYSVQAHHTEQLPAISKANKKKKYVVEDSIMGWADAVKVLMKAYLGLSRYKPNYDFSQIRPKGARLITAGGKAPGPEPLKLCLAHIESILESKKDGEKLKPIECHDILCHIANAVLAGGIRRAAMISLFDKTDEEMLACKSGNWWELNEQRGRANNSVILERGKVSKEEFDILWDKVKASDSGEPGFYWTNNIDWGTNPCCEIALRPYQFCNLTEVNVSDIESQEDLNNRVRAAAFFGTLQAGFTDFHYLRGIWRTTTEKDALIGVGMTGIGSGTILKYNLVEASNIVKEENEKVAKIIGINSAARTTTVKPAGTTSCVLGTSSGIHAWHNDYYIRRIRVGKNEALYTYLSIYHPELVEDEYFRPQQQAVVNIPQKAPNEAILRTETAIDLLERVKRFATNWVRAGHRNGDNTHNVSATISIDKNRKYQVRLDDSESFMDEWEVVGNWMWENRKFYNGLSVLPYDGGTYIQAPFEDITKERYEELIKSLTDVDLTKVIELDDVTSHSQEAACAGGKCEI